jgi:hypothetical protein
MRSIPENNLSYSLLIKLSNGGQGSGFNLIKDNNLYYVTAKHVLFAPDGTLLAPTGSIIGYSPDTEDETPTQVDINLELLIKEGNIISHPTRDVAVVRYASVIPTNENGGHHNVNCSNGVNLISASKLGVVNTIADQLMQFKDVLVGNDVILFGYPSSIGVDMADQFDKERPLLRKGIIAAKYKKYDTIILDCPVYYGNSGGPAMQISQEGLKTHYNIMGVVSQYVPYEDVWQNVKNGLKNSSWFNSGYSVVVSIDKVLELI